MRKNAGFMIMTLLLLTVPALANAWTLAVKVAGGTSTNNVNVAFGTTNKNFQGTSAFIYPVGQTTITDNSGSATTFQFDGATVVSPYVIPALPNLTGNHTLTVAYATTQPTSSVSLSQDPNGGGQIYAENKNNTWTSTIVTGLLPTDSVPVAIAADANHKIVSYNLGAGPVTMPTNSPAGQVLSLTAAAGKTVTATFGVAGQTTATLFAPTNGTTGVAITCNVTATSNDSPLTYAFAVSPAPAKAGVQAGSSFSFTPSSATTYTVTATVTSPNQVAAVVQSASIIVADAVVNANQACESCHSTQSPTIVANYNLSVHSGSTHSACSACHTSNTPHSAGINALNVNNATFAITSSAIVYTSTTNVTTTLAKGAVFCTACHNPLPHSSALAGTNTCVQCHTSATGTAGKGDAHQIQSLSCQGCHSVAQLNPFSDRTLVSDNNLGVRAITGEFTKWSHHIVNAPGVAIQDEQCAVCHLEGTVGGYGFGVDGTKHMVDNVTHLRNAQTDADMQWDPANPNHSTMDSFCMACHSAAGATSPMNLKLQALITPLTGKTASALNPFGDTISNQYDKMSRPKVVDVSDQFNTGNNSHHAVKGPRYSGRTRIAGARQVAATFANNSSATLPGARSTIFDAGKFNGLYVPLVNAGGETAPRTGAASLGDDSTLHCGDCHTVGQWKAGSATNADGTPTPVAIGAHGSANEYMLRNSIGTDARHQGIQMDASAAHADGVTPYLVCYNCHKIANYGLASHVGEQVVGENNCNTMTNTNTVNAIGTDRLNSQNTMTYGTNLVGAADGATASNIFGIQCNNCHKSGVTAGNIFGGIHGSADPTYTDGVGNTTKHERFLPGLGNVMYVPGTQGGITGGTTSTPVSSSLAPNYTFQTGGTTNDTNWEESNSVRVVGIKGSGSHAHLAGPAGCYTISDGIPTSDAEGTGITSSLVPASNGLTAPDGTTLLTGNWGGCADHAQAPGTSVRPPRSGNTSIRPVTY